MVRWIMHRLIFVLCLWRIVTTWFTYSKHPSEHGLWQLPNQPFVLHLCRMIWREWFQHFVTIMVWINNIVWIWSGVWYFVVIWCVKSIKQRLVQLRKNSFLVIIIVEKFFSKGDEHIVTSKVFPKAIGTYCYLIKVFAKAINVSLKSRKMIPGISTLKVSILWTFIKIEVWNQ